MWKNLVEPDRPQKKIKCGAYAFHAGYVKLQTHTQNRWNLLVCNRNNGYSKARPYWVTGTLPLSPIRLITPAPYNLSSDRVQARTYTNVGDRRFGKLRPNIINIRRTCRFITWSVASRHHPNPHHPPHTGVQTDIARCLRYRGKLETRLKCIIFFLSWSQPVVGLYSQPFSGFLASSFEVSRSHTTTRHSR